jgi:hypothetical protein
MTNAMFRPPVPQAEIEWRAAKAQFMAEKAVSDKRWAKIGKWAWWTFAAIVVVIVCIAAGFVGSIALGVFMFVIAPFLAALSKPGSGGSGSIFSL